MYYMEIMRAMIFTTPGKSLQLVELPMPKPEKGQLLIQVHACGVCRTDLHILDGELSNPKLPLILGHQIVGTVIEAGPNTSFKIGKRIGVPWLQGSCGNCRFCLSDKENLCDRAVFTGYTVDGGFAEYCVANADFCFPLPDSYDDEHAAPLLCAGLIGYRAYKMTEEAKILGFYGFGASAHILAQVAAHQHKKVYAFTRKGDEAAQKLALKLGCHWAGSSDEMPPQLLEAAIVFAPVGSLIPKTLAALDKGGIAICAGIHMSDIPSFPYELLWEERCVRSVANLTRQDGKEFLTLAGQIPIHTHPNCYPLEKANEALEDLRNGKILGAAVVKLPEQAQKTNS
jgi:propanol-preferring alcohol dehydrogenase